MAEQTHRQSKVRLGYSAQVVTFPSADREGDSNVDILTWSEVSAASAVTVAVVTVDGFVMVHIAHAGEGSLWR